ncbi:MAG: polyisoprenoid-binding protein [Nitrospinae bacterium]|nr:polyisoprenoid-binding protein [Nitrospinota bacterium]
MITRLLFTTALALALAFSPALAGQHVIDPAHTTVGFAVKHLVISNVQGKFDKFEGGFVLDDKGELSGVTASIDAASINTAIKDRDDHLRSPDFLDVAKFPTLTFVSKKVTRKGNTYAIAGDLTIRGVTKPVTLNAELLGRVKDPWGFMRAGFHAETVINRKDFGANFHKVLEAGGLVVDDMVKIALDVEGILQQPAAEAKK